MPRIHFIGNLRQFTAGEDGILLPATSVKHLFRLLEERYPGIGPHLAEGMAVVIDGQIYQDALFQEIPADAEVHLMPAIAGG